MSTSTFIYSLTSSVYVRSDSEPDYADVVKSTLLELTTQQYFKVALASLLIYHALITMDQEVKYFWPRPLNSISLVYFANRYVGLLGATSSIGAADLIESYLSCETTLWMNGLCNLVTVVPIDYILVVRVLAFYPEGRKKLAIFLKFLIGLEMAIDLSILVYDRVFEKIVVGELGGGITFCGGLREPPQVLAIISWVVPMAFGLLLLSLSLYKATEYWRLSSGFKGFHLVKVLIRDQGLYYGGVILCSILRIASSPLSHFSPFVGTILIAVGSPTLLCILGGQLLINLKEAGELGVNGGTNYRSKSVSDIEFAEVVGAPREEGQPSENVEDVPSFEDHLTT